MNRASVEREYSPAKLPLSSVAQLAKACSLIALVGAMALASLGEGRAHDVPDRTTVIAFAKPQGSTLTLLVRAPMKALRDVDVPTRENGFLDFFRLEPALDQAATVWISDLVEVFENGARLPKPRIVAVRVSLPSDRSFRSFGDAFATLRGPPLAADTQIYWEQGLLDVAFEYPVVSDKSDFAIAPGLTPLGITVDVVLHFLPVGGAERAFNVQADVGIVHLDPRWYQAFLSFVREGFFHILDGIDHLLFLLCLVLPLRRFGPLLAAVTAFTAAHSMTLIASALGLAPDALWFPPLIETLIAASILYMALENIVGPRLERRWLITFFFGLVHGFGFSFLLRERLQFAGAHLFTSLLAFNIGVELGQVLVLAIAILAIGLLFRYVIAERMGTIILSALVAHTAWHWMIARGQNLSRYPLSSLLDAVTLSNLLGWAIALVVASALTWLVSGFIRRKNEPGLSKGPGRAPSGEPAHPAEE